jgi:hypothetical protein
MAKVILIALPLLSGLLANALDLTHAVVVAPPFDGPEKKAIEMLVDEVAARSQVRWRLAGDGTPAIRVARKDTQPSEGYTLQTDASGVTITGNDARGVLFGIGHLLRNLEMSRGRVDLPRNLNVTTAPKYRLRGHQLGFRPKTNSYDGWTVAMWEQYIRDLAVFGSNAIELIPPRSDDDADSPHFPLPPMQMMIEMSRLAAAYGLECWIWYPAMDKDYSDPKTVEFAIKEWGEVFRQLPRVDAVFVPGGDPGHTQPKHLMALLEKQTANLRRYHPTAQMWVSPQSFSGDWMEEFFSIVKTEPAWLGGIVFGPQVRLSLEALRARVPARLPVRFYPDITHSLRSQYPVPDWDVAFALTLQREPINPRPIDQAQIFRRLQPHAAHGFLTYSEGCNDDVNKIVWSRLGWDPDARVIDILRDYSRYFIGPRVADSFAQGLLSLEQNWRGKAISNEGIYNTLASFRDLEHAATPAQKLNWRFQQALYRAYYDAYVRARALSENVQEQNAMQALREARRSGSSAAMETAERLLTAYTTPSADWRSRVFELAEALFQSARMQLSVERYNAIAVGRGANLDLIDTPLSNKPWLLSRFATIRKMETEPERLRAIEEIVNWTNPGPGGFYDDLGDPANQPHLIRGEGFAGDPAFLTSSLVAFGNRPANIGGRISWWTHAETLNDQPLEMLYPDLDPAAQYRVRVVYGGDAAPVPIRLMANEKFAVHPFTPKPAGFVPLEFDVPREATAAGQLRLTWSKPLGLGGNGRGVQVAEVWLMRKDPQ